MAMQNQLDNSTRPFILYNYPSNRKKGTIKKDTGRTAVLKQYTVLGKIAATGLYVPLTSATATDGSAIPAGIYIGEDIAADTLKAGNVTDCDILTSGARFDAGQLVIENSLTLNTVVKEAVASIEDATYTPAVFVPAVYVQAEYTPEVFEAGDSTATLTPSSYTPATYTPATYTPATFTGDVEIEGTDVRTIGDHLESRMLVAVDTDAASAYEA